MISKKRDIFCYCGNIYGKLLAPSESDCYSRCSGWPDQKCGGAWRVNIYKIAPGNLYEGDKLNQKEMLISQNGNKFIPCNADRFKSRFV